MIKRAYAAFSQMNDIHSQDVLDELSPRRVLVVDTICWRSHLETSMELALRAHESGASVYYLNLRDRLPHVEDHTWLPKQADINQSRAARAATLLARQGILVCQSGITNTQRTLALKRADREISHLDVASLKLVRHEGFFDLGWAVLSSAITITGNPSCSPLSDPRLFRDLYASAILVFDEVRRLIQECGIDAVILFNGRFATTRAILRAAQSSGVQPLIHERGRDKHHYRIDTQLSHDPDYIQSRIKSAWDTSYEPIADEYFRNRRKRIESSWYSFTKLQTTALLPEEITAEERSVKWVTFYTSSEDEYSAVGDSFENQHFPSQADALLAVAEALKPLPDHRLCIRIHPHLSQKKYDVSRISRLPGLRNAVIVPAESKVDSYALMDKSDVICSYGSTIGLEANYWGKPCLILKRCHYDLLDVGCTAKSIEEIRSFVANPEVKPKIGALMYGAYYAQLGTAFRYYRADDLRTGAILGERLDPSWLLYVRKVYRYMANKPFS